MRLVDRAGFLVPIGTRTFRHFNKGYVMCIYVPVCIYVCIELFGN